MSKSIQQEVNLSLDRLRGKIKERGLSQVEFSRLVGVSDTTMSSWLTGKTTFDYTYIYIFNEILKLTPEDQRYVWLT